jgi:L-threonylcarbamoyladenylate synthase
MRLRLINSVKKSNSEKRSKPHMSIFNATSHTIEQAAQCLRGGGLVAFPTETVYGLGADARNSEALTRIFIAKNRPQDHPLIVHLASFEQFDAWACDISESAVQLAQHFFPAPLAIILKKRPDINTVVTGGQDTVALRVPNHPVALDLLRAFGDGIAAPSANRFCRISPTQATHVQQELGDSVDMILDGGACQIGVESTIIDLSGDHPMLLRYGQIMRSELEKVLNLNVLIPDALRKSTVRTAGMMAAHYAPSTPAMLCENTAIPHFIETNTQMKIGVLSCGDTFLSYAHCTVISLPSNPIIYAQNLYAKLRELDALKLDVILVQTPPQTEDWQAINDRLAKATHNFREH